MFCFFSAVVYLLLTLWSKSGWSIGTGNCKNIQNWQSKCVWFYPLKEAIILTCLLDCTKILHWIDGYFWPKTFLFIFSGKVYWFGKRMDAKICYVMRNWRTKNIKTAPKTYNKNNNIRKTKNQEISSSRFLFPPTPLKKNITNRVWQNWKTIHLKKSLPVLLIFILEIKRTHILKYFFFREILFWFHILK